jgi:hypothetical protein
MLRKRGGGLAPPVLCIAWHRLALHRIAPHYMAQQSPKLVQPTSRLADCIIGHGLALVVCLSLCLPACLPACHGSAAKAGSAVGCPPVSTSPTQKQPMPTYITPKEWNRSTKPSPIDGKSMGHTDHKRQGQHAPAAGSLERHPDRLVHLGNHHITGFSIARPLPSH